jgi:predicted phage terminase large subunit-like protein
MPGGTITLQQTRWHDDDLAGRLLKAALKDKRASQWVVICLAATNDDGRSSYIWNTKTGEKKYLPKYEALWPQFQSREELDRIQVDQGPTFWSALYQQAPIAAQGTIFQRGAWKYFQQLPVIERLIQVYDTALEEKKDNDYSAGIDLLHTQVGYAVPDAWRDRVPFPQLVAKVYDRWEQAGARYGRYPERLLVENKGSGISLRQQIEANNLVGEWIGPDGARRAVPIIPVLGMPAIESKEVRAHGVSGYQNAGTCWLPERADWLDDFLDETSTFPKGANDDWVDCVVHGLTYFTRPVVGAEQEEVIVSGDEITISSDLDDYDQGWM